MHVYSKTKVVYITFCLRKKSGNLRHSKHCVKAENRVLCVISVARLVHGFLRVDHHIQQVFWGSLQNKLSKGITVLNSQRTVFIFWLLIDNFKTDMEVLEADLGETLVLSEEWREYQVLLSSPIPSNSHYQFLMLDLSFAINSYVLPLQNSQDIFPELHIFIKQRFIHIFKISLCYFYLLSIS